MILVLLPPFLLLKVFYHYDLITILLLTVMIQMMVIVKINMSICHLWLLKRASRVQHISEEKQHLIPLTYIISKKMAGERFPGLLIFILKNITIKGIHTFSDTALICALPFPSLLNLALSIILITPLNIQNTLFHQIKWFFFLHRWSQGTIIWNKQEQYQVHLQLQNKIITLLEIEVHGLALHLKAQCH